MKQFHFKYAQIAFSVGLLQTAFESVSKYLSAETEGESYKEALALLIKIEEELKELEISPEKTCNGKPVGTSCWMVLTNHPECYVWNPYLQKDEIVTWTGKCSGKVAQGEGTLTFAVTNGDSLKILETGTGHLQNSHFHDQWVWRASDGNTGTTTYVNGRRQD